MLKPASGTSTPSLSPNSILLATNKTHSSYLTHQQPIFLVPTLPIHHPKPYLMAPPSPLSQRTRTSLPPQPPPLKSNPSTMTPTSKPSPLSTPPAPTIPSATAPPSQLPSPNASSSAPTPRQYQHTCSTTCESLPFIPLPQPPFPLSTKPSPLPIPAQPTPAQPATSPSTGSSATNPSTPPTSRNSTKSKA